MANWEWFLLHWSPYDVLAACALSTSASWVAIEGLDIKISHFSLKEGWGKEEGWVF